jgi:hypothetical protein
MNTQIEFLKNRLSQLDYDNNGNPIGIDLDEYNEIVETLESLEDQNPNEDRENDYEYQNERESNFINVWK